MYTDVSKGVWVCLGVFGTRTYTNVQEYTPLYTHLHECTKIYSNVHGYTRTYTSALAFIPILRRYTAESSGVWMGLGSRGARTYTNKKG